MQIKKQAATLSELIVVIAIILILGTIAFISLQGYGRNARDSVRISDMSKIQVSLEHFRLYNGKYPEASEYFIIKCLGINAWTQGIFGKSIFNNVEKLDKIPLDPLTGKEYAYSTTNTRKEFQIAGIIERDDIVLSNKLINQTNAREKTAILKITGNYNGRLINVSTGGTTYVLSVPSLITSTGGTLEDIVQNKYLAYNGFKNLSTQYSNSSYRVFGESLDDGLTSNLNLVNTNNLVAYSGSLATLSRLDQAGIDARLNLITNLKNAYIGTAITNIDGIIEITTLDINDSEAVELLSSTIVNNNLGGKLIIIGN